MLMDSYLRLKMNNLFLFSADEHNYALSSVEELTSCNTTLPVLETPAKGHTGNFTSIMYIS